MKPHIKQESNSSINLSKNKMILILLVLGINTGIAICLFVALYLLQELLLKA